MSDELRPFELGTPGPMRDRLVAAVLAGDKTATSSLRLSYDLDSEPLPRPGDRFRMVDSAQRSVGVVRTTRVDVLRLGEVGDDVARAEGEGFADRTAWRVPHEEFWRRYADDVRAFLGVDAWRIDDDTGVVVEHFMLEGRATRRG